jgi:hypothetical protein
MWNLVPADPHFNSMKSDKLPVLNSYFDGFFEVQKEGVKIVKQLNPKNKFLEDYLSIFPTLDFSKDKYRETIEPMLTIASNNGFRYMEE